MALKFEDVLITQLTPQEAKNFEEAAIELQIMRRGEEFTDAKKRMAFRRLCGLPKEIAILKWNK